jgi:hypothetical protein
LSKHRQTGPVPGKRKKSWKRGGGGKPTKT